MFLVLTITGIFMSLAFIVFSAFYVVNDWRSIASEIGAVNVGAWLDRMRTQLSGSLFGGLIFIGTFFSYRRYHKLAFDLR